MELIIRKDLIEIVTWDDRRYQIDAKHEALLEQSMQTSKHVKLNGEHVAVSDIKNIRPVTGYDAQASLTKEQDKMLKAKQRWYRRTFEKDAPEHHVEHWVRLILSGKELTT